MEMGQGRRHCQTSVAVVSTRPQRKTATKEHLRRRSGKETCPAASSKAEWRWRWQLRMELYGNEWSVLHWQWYGISRGVSHRKMSIRGSSNV